MMSQEKFTYSLFNPFLLEASWTNCNFSPLGKAMPLFDPFIFGILWKIDFKKKQLWKVKSQRLGRIQSQKSDFRKVRSTPGDTASGSQGLKVK